MSEAERIVGKLTEAQINVLSFPNGHHSFAARRSVRAKGLLTLADTITPLGLEVRRLLQEQANGR